MIQRALAIGALKSTVSNFAESFAISLAMVLGPVTRAVILSMSMPVLNSLHGSLVKPKS